MSRFATLLATVLLFSFTAVLGQEALTITTWNVETLGGDGRGFASGFGRGSLPQRTDAQLGEIAALIRDTLGSDIVALQEVTITSIDDDGFSINEPLETITAELGPSWDYFIPFVDEIPQGHDNLFCALMWNEERVAPLSLFAMDLPNPQLAGANLFDREPVVGYFQAINDGAGTNDFVIVNVHLKSGQQNEENHLIAMTVLEHALTSMLADFEVQESDRIILGDFNDNPFATTAAGNQRFSTAMYEHMEFKKYQNLVTESTGATRMNTGLDSIIDHVLVNNSTRGHMSSLEIDKFMPEPAAGMTLGETLAEWRVTFSDHFPLSFTLNVANADDDVDFE